MAIYDNTEASRSVVKNLQLFLKKRSTDELRKDLILAKDSEEFERKGGSLVQARHWKFVAGLMEEELEKRERDNWKIA